MKKLKVNVYQGSYTVEAVFIMPLIIFVIMALIYMAMYMHDKNKVKAVLDKTAAEASLIVKHETDNLGNIEYDKLDNRGIFFPVTFQCEEEEKKLLSILNSQLKSGLLLGEIENISLKANHSKIQIKVRVNMKIALLNIRKYFRNSGTNIVISGIGDVYYPAEYIRKFNGIENVAEDINGYHEVLEKFQKLLGGR